jgi:hypothetical protein
MAYIAPLDEGAEGGKMKIIIYMDEEHGLESRWTWRSQNSERDQMSYQGHQLGTSEVKDG